MASWHTPYKKPNGERALTRKRARALNTAMKLECVSKSVRYMRSHKKQRTRLNKTKVNVEAIWLECPELENKPHLLILSAGVITTAAFETTAINFKRVRCFLCERM